MGNRNILGFIGVLFFFSQSVYAGFWSWLPWSGSDRSSSPSGLVQEPVVPLKLVGELKEESKDPETRKAELTLQIYQNATALEGEIGRIHRISDLVRGIGNPTDAATYVGGRFLFQGIFEDRLLQAAYLQKKVVATFVGVTKAGKSTIFNSAVRDRVSLVHHRSGMTKHPVIAVHPKGDEVELARTIFKYPVIQKIVHADEAAKPHGDLRVVFWHPVPAMDENLILIDAPDCDSDNTENWAEAEKAARVSDIIVAVVNEGKTRTKAMSDFYRRVATESGKPVILVINKVSELSFEFEMLSDFANEFRESTGLHPIETLVVPLRKEAKDHPERVGSVKFFRLQDLQGRSLEDLPREHSFIEIIKQLDTQRIKLDSLRAELLQAIDGHGGVNHLLREAEHLGRRYALLKRALSEVPVEGDPEFETLSQLQLRVDWPAIPAPLFESAYREWWAPKQHATNRIGAALGDNVQWGVSWILNRVGYSKEDPTAAFERAEMDAVRKVVSAMINILKDSQKLFPGVLSQRSMDLLNNNHIEIADRVADWFGKNKDKRADFVAMLKAQFPIWEKEHPTKVQALHAADYLRNTVLQLGVAAVATPFLVIYSSATAVGAGATAVKWIANPVGQVASGAFSAGVNSQMINMGSALAGDSFWKRMFSELHAIYARQNIELIFSYLFLQNDSPLKGVMDEIQWGQTLTERPSYQAAKNCIQKLKDMMQAGSP